MKDTNAERVARKAKRWFEDRIVEDVPDRLASSIACCNQQGRMGEWEPCQRRLQDVQDRRSWKATHP